MRVHPAGAVARSTDPFPLRTHRLKALGLSTVPHEPTMLKCDAYRADLGDKVEQNELMDFLGQFGDFCRDYSTKMPQFFPTVLDKSVSFTIVGATKLSATLHIGAGRVRAGVAAPNKHYEISAQQFRGILDRTIVPQRIYAGFGANESLFPARVYNRDVISYLVMFAYKYQWGQPGSVVPLHTQGASATS